MPALWFSLLNVAILPFWLLLIFAPRWRYTQRIVHGAGVFMLLGIVYTVCLFKNGLVPLTDLESGMKAFQQPWLFLAGWTHYLSFDLMVGAWVSRDALRHGVSHWFVVPSLLLVLNLGPLGLLLYLAIRLAVRKRWSLAEA